jgi:copper chaperone
MTMETETLKAQNIKCGGCASTIRDGLSQLPGIEQVEVDIESGEVTLQGESLDRAAVSSKLAELGYPVAD